MAQADLSNVFASLIENYAGAISSDFASALAAEQLKMQAECAGFRGFAGASRRLREHGEAAFSIGDIIETEHEDLGPMEWVVIGINHDRVGIFPNSITVMARRPLPKPMAWSYDPSGRGYIHSNVMSSDLMRYLGDEFKYGFSAEDLAVVAHVAKRFYAFDPNLDDGEVDEWNHNVDSGLLAFFPLSLSEFGIREEGVIDEGGAYEYFADCPDSDRAFTDENGTSVMHWTRSPSPNSSQKVAAITHYGGTYLDKRVDEKYYVVPACVIF